MPLTLEAERQTFVNVRRRPPNEAVLLSGSTSTMTSNAIVYILAQTQENIEFLRSASQISQDDARDILAKLSAAPGFSGSRKPVTPPSAIDDETNRSFTIPLTPAISDVAPTPPKIAALSRPPPPIPSSYLFKARARWGYNENTNEPGDLSFSQGDVIDIVDHNNPDWWRGRLRGNEGIFPSSYVEVLGQDIEPPYSEKHSMRQTNVPPPGNMMYSPPYPPYQQQPPQNTYYGPPPGAPYPPYQGGPQSMPVQTAPGETEPKKKHGFFKGSMGNTLAHSAVGGVGFGAGSAVGGGIINALF